MHFHVIYDIEIEYDIEILNGNKIVTACNNLSRYIINEEEYRDDLLRINLDEEYYKTNPEVYWNEIEMDLTASQRKAIAEFDWTEKLYPDEIDGEIKRFLDYVYMCDNNRKGHE